MSRDVYPLLFLQGDIVDSVTTFYDMTAGGGAWMSEQRSWLYSPSVGAGEAALSPGAGMVVLYLIIERVFRLLIQLQEL